MLFIIRFDLNNASAALKMQSVQGISNNLQGLKRMPQRTETNSAGYWYAGLTVLIWSGFILVSRLGGVSPLNPFDMTALRFGTAALVLLPIWIVQRPLRLASARMASLALTGGLGYALLVYWGFKLTPATHAAVLLPGLLPFEIALFGWLLLGERLSHRRMLGLAFIAMGVGCVATESFRAGLASWRGDLAILGASLCWALYTVLARRWRVAPWAATVGVALLTGLVYLPIYALFLPKALAIASWTTILLQAFYQGILAVIVAMLFYMKAVATIGPMRMGALMALVPAASGFAATPILGEPLSFWSISGLVLVSAGAYLSTADRLSIVKRTRPCLT
jgi:drug/metabolite transporter (DMT)-like permease